MLLRALKRKKNDVCVGGRERDKMSDSRDTPFVFSSLIGAAFGVLCVPKSGRETRSNIKKSAKK
jgi:hypothetical protein